MLVMMKSTPQACIVVFTNGNGPYPLESSAMGIPVLWILDNNEYTPPWGTVVRIITRDNFIK